MTDAEMRLSLQLDERRWFVREKVLDSFYIRHAIELPAIAVSSDMASISRFPFDIQWRWRSQGMNNLCYSYLFRYGFYIKVSF